MSKEFTAAAVLLLAQDGKLSLGDDVRKYFPEMPPFASGVTIHNWDAPTVGGRALIDSLLVRGRLKGDSTIPYALGVNVDTWRGLPTVSHGGSWAGYRAHFIRFPEQHLIRDVGKR